jgi:tetratricopeptide (TPR) repeat protein
MGNLEKALADNEKAVEWAPDDHTAHLAASHRQLANALKLRDGERALEHAKMAVKLDPTHYENFLVLGQVCRAAGELQSALIHFDRAAQLAASPVATDRVSYNANQTRSDYYKSEGRYEEALAAQTKVLPLCSNSAEAGNEHYQRGEIYLAMQDYGKALADFSKSIELAPEQYHFYKRRAITHFQMGSYDDALADLDKAVELNPEDLSSLTWIPPSQVAACPDDGFHRGLLELADETIELTSDSGRAYATRGVLHAAFGQHDEASTDFDKAIELSPEEPIFLYWVALSRLGRNDVGGYRTACTQMLRQFGDSEDPQDGYWTAWTCLLGLEAVNDFSIPLALAEQAAHRDPKSISFLNALGGILYRAGRAEEAVERLTEAAGLIEDPTSPAKSSPAYTWYFLAMAHQAAGHHEEAKRWLAKAVEWTDEALREHEREGGAWLRWNRRLTLKGLRDEAEAMINDDD